MKLLMWLFIIALIVVAPPTGLLAAIAVIWLNIDEEATDEDLH